MKTRQTTSETTMTEEGNRCGSALMPMLMLTSILAICAAGMVSMVRNEASGVRKVTLVADVNFIAEAGANHGLAVCKAGNALPPPGGTVSETNFHDGGSYAVTIDPMEGESYRITSVATKDNYSVAVNILYRPGGGNPVSAFDYGLFADQDIDVNGTGGYTADAHANQDADIGEQTLVGDLSAVGTADGPNVTGSVVSGAPAIPWPTIDWAHYYSQAVLDGSAPGGAIPNGTHQNGIFTSSITVNGSGTVVLSPPSGVVWVEGDVTFNGRKNLVVHGTLIATGQIRFDARSTFAQTGPAHGLAVASRDSSLLFNGFGTMAAQGLLIANGGNFRRNGTVPSSVTGAIMAKGDIIINGGIDGMIYVPYAPPDVAEEEVGDIMDVLAWYKTFPDASELESESESEAESTPDE